MAFNPVNLFVTGLFCLSSLIACAPYDKEESKEDENIIGKKVEAVTDIQYSSSGNLGVMAVFDETIRKIHQFDLEGMKHLRSLEVKHPSQDHYLLHDPNGQYTIDLTKKHMSIYKIDGSIVHEPVRFLGEPISSSFRPKQGFLVFYDDLLNVSILQLTPSGNVIKSLVLGPILSTDISIQSGDISESGHLVLGMSDGSLRRVDLKATLDSGSWVFDTHGTTWTDLKWIAPVPGQPNQMMIRSHQTVSVYDFITKLVVSEITTDETYVVFKYSKSENPHILLAELTPTTLKNDGVTLAWKNSSLEKYSLIYLEGSELKRRELPREDQPVLLSHLDLTTNQWAVVRGATKSPYSYNNLNSVRKGRRLSKTAFSHGGALAENSLPDNTVLKLSRDYVFALFPSELGYAQRIHIESGEIKELKLFNMRQIKR